MDGERTKKKLNRRKFLHSAAAAGAGLAFSRRRRARANGGGKADDINVALLGAGSQGHVLIHACRRIPGIRFKAVCDIWAAFNRKRISRMLKAYGHEHNTYADYKEMLDNETDLDAVIIATPDFWHSPHTVACLDAGLHVYCETAMSDTLEGARKMVEAAKKSGKLLQIGCQRRSNPRYRYCYEKLVDGAELPGTITTVNGQWNRSKAACEDLGFPKNAEIDKETLKKYGFDSMHQFRNWRWYKGLGGGPIVELGSHQIDIYNWFLGTHPKAVMAGGGIDYWKGRDWYDNVMAIYEYDLGDRTVRAFYQTITTNSSQGYFETFMGDEGSLQMSEISGRGAVYREKWVPPENWEKWVKMGIISEPEKEQEQGRNERSASDFLLQVQPTPPPPSYDIPLTTEGKPHHQPHLENFFDAIRGRTTLNCPAEVGYKTAVAVLKVNEAIAAGRKLRIAYSG
ncbi:MAG: Gfo/Idh/MocA family protein [Planctomycetota bacterium]|jgi:predicted dehydrogenase